MASRTERLARSALSGDVLSILLRNQVDSPIIFAYWTKFYDSLPELVAVAFSQVVDIFPSSKAYALHCLANSRKHHRLLHEPIDERTLIELLVCSWRLLRHDRLFFGALDWPVVSSCLKHESRAIRYLAIQIQALFFNAADACTTDAVRDSVGCGSTYTVLDPFGTLDLAIFEVADDRRIADAKALLIESPYFRDETVKDLLPDNIVNVFGVLLPFLNTPSGSQVADAYTSETTQENMAKLAKVVSAGDALLVQGPSGSGKTFMIDKLAKMLGRYKSMVRIHLGAQTDTKLLLGTYVTSSTAGQFTWQEGVLTTAVRQGRWVLIEDIDKASSDALSIILPLLERRTLILPGRDEVIQAGPNFQLVGTRRTDPKTNSAPLLLGMRLWKLVSVDTLPLQEVRQIICDRFPLLHELVDTMLLVYESICESINVEESSIRIFEGSFRPIGLLDLMKWCRRMDSFLATDVIRKPNAPLSQAIFDNMFCEAVDCFASSRATLETIKEIARVIGKSLGIPWERVDSYLQSHCPTLDSRADTLVVGRARLKKKSVAISTQGRPFAFTNHSLRLLEQLIVSVNLREPVLLVGETGTGKTTITQQLADLVGQKLIVINMSQQTETGDLLGGYKPVDSKMMAIPLLDEFEPMFEETMSAVKNARFLREVRKNFQVGHWSRFVMLLREASSRAVAKLGKRVRSITAAETGTESRHKRRRNGPDLLSSWAGFADRLDVFEMKLSQSRKSFLFAFIEGIFIRALRDGNWVLLDEINLAATDTLDSIHDLLQEQGSIMLAEKGDLEPIIPHSDFRLFACMNPATDVGKRDLPAGIRSRFTEVYVQSPDARFQDLIAIINKYIGSLCLQEDTVCVDVAHLHLLAKKLAIEGKIVDGANSKPHYSVRTLSRTMSFVLDVTSIFGLRRALYEGFCMSYLTLLDASSEKVLRPLIEEYTISKVSFPKSISNQIPKMPAEGSWVNFHHYWLRRGPNEPSADLRYVITPSVEKNLLNLARAAMTQKYPILLQGPTSSGKTSMVEYLAGCTGHNCVRINNHEHTDLQEYLGTYSSNSQGNFVFEEGILVKALRWGHWLVLDELNLAPSDVLEALNRLLDDNRELLIPETQEVIKPHPNFVLFATQNPAGLYGGRKHLSRAFRNRFLELNFDDIPEHELEVILCQRCQIAPSYCRRIVEVYSLLSTRRQSSRLFEHRNSFATLRDLFRWANRPAIGYQEVAMNGYLLLGERVRREDEKATVREIIENVMRVSLEGLTDYVIDNLGEYQDLSATGIASNIVWTRSMRRLFLLVLSAFHNREPVLLVGGTGCGKTTICQIVSDAMQIKLRTLNAHQNTETSDFIGAMRPARNPDRITGSLQQDIQIFLKHCGCEPLTTDIDTLQISLAQLDFADRHESEALQLQAEALYRRIESSKATFEWADGPLVKSMKDGDVLLIDEISLAEDAVLERLNSVLELKRTLVLAEKAGHESVLLPHPDFQICATMNPGGDYGKKELSPALRNRFTEIWVPPISSDEDVLQILDAKLPLAYKHLAQAMLCFAKVFSNEFASSANSSVLSIRDLLAWCQFCRTIRLPVHEAFVQGAALVYIDGLGHGSLLMHEDEHLALARLRTEALTELSRLSGIECGPLYELHYELVLSTSSFSIGPFAIDRGQNLRVSSSFRFDVPTSHANAMRILRAMQLSKPVLLEGSPGVGKTSLVSAIADLSRKSLIRINLCEQTDLADLFGSDTPLEHEDTLAFGWRDAPFLQAMQNGAWVLLDEMNLASQSILEGLNACLDHRGEVYIPELDKSFTCHPDFRVFAAQNPLSQGGGRKGLPKSFVNRFTVVYCDPLVATDIQQICTRIMPQVDEKIITQVISFITAVQERLLSDRLFGLNGRPWELNLRDILRWLSILNDPTQTPFASYFSHFIVGQRMRTMQDLSVVNELATGYFGHGTDHWPSYAELTVDSVTIGKTQVNRNPLVQPQMTVYRPIRNDHRLAAEALLLCVKHHWPGMLVGSTGCGKSSLIHAIASLLGHRIETITMSSDMDAGDLLGSFEQRDVRRNAARIFSEVSEILKTRQFARVSSEWSLVQSQVLDDIFSARYTSDLARRSAELLEVSGVTKTHKIYSELDILLNDLTQDSVGQFQWVHGSLVRAAQQGSWVILDNANLCNPSVLDRINSLMEPNGHLIINERIMPDGSPMVLVPDSNFRLFLTIDPTHGELSPAMRNRCMEIFLLPDTMNSDTFLPSIRAEQCLWKCVEGATRLPLDMQVSDESLLEEAILYHLPRELEWRQLPVSSNSSGCILESIEQLYGSELVKTCFQSSSASVLFTMRNSLASCSNALSSTPLPTESDALQLAVLSHSTRPIWRKLVNGNSRAATPKVVAQELQLLYQFGDTILETLDSINKTASSQEIQACIAILLLMQYSATQSVLYGWPRVLMSVFRMLRGLLQSADGIALRQPGIRHLVKSSRYCRESGSGWMLDALWLKFRSHAPDSRVAQVQFDTISLTIEQIDEVIQSNRQLVEHATVLQMRCLGILSEVSQTKFAETLDVVQECKELNGSAASASSIDFNGPDSDYDDLFCQILWRVQLAALSEFELWKTSQAPGLSNLCSLSILSRKSSADLLGFYDHNITLSISSASRHSCVLSTCLRTFLSVNQPIDTPKAGLISHWQKILHDSTEVPLGNFEGNLCNLRQISVQIAQNGDSILRPTLRDMSQTILYKLYQICTALSPAPEIFGEWTTCRNDQGATSGRNVDQQSLINLRHCHQLKTFMDEYDNPKLPRIVSRLFYTITESIQAVENHQSRSLAIAWISLARLFLILYLPDIPTDPAMDLIFKSQYNKWLVERTAERLHLDSAVHRIFTGASVSSRTKALKDDLGRATAELMKATSVEVFRSESSQMDELQSEFDHCIAAVASGGELESLVVKFLPGDKNVLKEIELCENSWRTLEARLNRYCEYIDIIGPVLEAVAQLRTGLSLLHADCKSAEVDRIPVLTLESHLTPLILVQKSHLHDLLAYRGRSADVNEISIKALQIVLLHGNLFRDKEAMATSTHLVLERLFRHWYVQRSKLERQNNENSSLYKYNAVPDADDGDYRDIFPDYESEETFLKIEDHEDEKHSQSQIFRLHSRIMDIVVKPDFQSSASLMETIRSFAEFSHNNIESVSDEPLDMIGASLHLASCTLRRLQSQQPLSAGYDFYRSPNIQEVRRLVPLMNKLKVRIRQIMSAWPENSILREIDDCTTRLLLHKSTAPLAQVLTMLEQSYALLAQWQVVASQEFSVSTHLEAMCQQIVEWRRFELSCWPRLFDLEEQSTRSQDSKIWYNLYEVILFAPFEQLGNGTLSGDFLSQNAALLLQFIQSSSLGQFSGRLEYLQAFSRHLTCLTTKQEMRPLARALWHIISYYSQYEKQVQDRLIQERKSLAKEVIDLVKIASWKDTNIFSLRESARRSHRMLYKVVQRYRRVLHAPVDAILTSGLEGIPSHVQAAANHPTHKANVSQYRMSPQSRDLPYRFAESQKTSEKIHKIALNDNLEFDNPLAVYVEDAVVLMRTLQQETPVTNDKSQIQLIKHLKTRKRKLLSDSFKVFKTLGLRSVMRMDDLERQTTLKALFLHTEADTNGLLPAIIDSYFFRIADLLPRIRRGYSDHADDISTEEVRRGTAYFDSLLSYVVIERSGLINFARQRSQMTRAFEQLRSLTEHDSAIGETLIVSGGVQVLLACAEDGAERCRICLELFTLTESYHEAFCDSYGGSVESLCDQDWWIELVSQTKVFLERLTRSESCIFPTADLEETSVSFQEHLGSIYTQIERNQAKHPPCSFVFRVLTNWLACQQIIVPGNLRPHRDGNMLSAQELEPLIQQICDLMLFAAQNVATKDEQILKLDKETNWFADYSRLSCKKLQPALLCKIVAALDQFLLDLRIGLIGTSHETLSKIMSNYVPIMAAYLDMCDRLYESFIVSHRNLSRCTLLVANALNNIASSGFCSPQTGEDLSKDSKATTESTGLADGPGVQHEIHDTDDVEFEDDEIAGNDPNFEAEADQGDAKEVGSEFGDGPLEDAEADSDGRSDDDEADGHSSLDEELGSVDDDDDMALDDKLWDDKHEESRDKAADGESQSSAQEQAQTDLVDKKSAEQDHEVEPHDVDRTPAPEAEAEDPDNDDVESQHAENDAPENKAENQTEPTEKLELPDGMDLDREPELEAEICSDDAVPSDEEGSERGAEEYESSEVGEDPTSNRGTPEIEEAPITPENQNETTDHESILSTDDQAAAVAEAFDTSMSDVEADHQGGTEHRSRHDDPYEDQDTSEPSMTEVPDRKPVQQESDAIVGDRPQEAQTIPQTALENFSENEDSASRQLRSLADKLDNFRRMLRIANVSESEDTRTDNQLPENTLTNDQFEHVGEEVQSDAQVMGPNAEDDMADHAQIADNDIPPLEDNRPEMCERDTNHAGPVESRPLEKTNRDLLQDWNNHMSTDVPVDYAESSVNEDEINMEASKVDYVSSVDLKQTTQASLQWQRHELNTRDLANGLVEQLRLILEPTLATKLRGDYRSGKRLNMRRIIPYIASQFKKDKIWMRRSQPSKRQYQVMLAIDDSKSMSEPSCIQLTFDTVALVASALSLLEVGQMAVVKFGSSAEVVHGFQDPFSNESGRHIYSAFNFDQPSTDIMALTTQSRELFRASRRLQHSSGAELWQLQFIISDGICENHDSIRQVLRQAHEERIMVIFVIMDTLNSTKQHSILQMSQVTYLAQPDGTKKLSIKQYMEDFAFRNFLIVQNVADLPSLLCSAMRQFFSESR